MSNYPPGVTGNEPQIAGPSYEEEVERTCGSCGTTDLVVIQGYGYLITWQCAECGEDHEEEVDSGPDPDEAYERRREQEWEERGW